jgi:predicted Rdx family selenoprotein
MNSYVTILGVSVWMSFLFHGSITHAQNLSPAAGAPANESTQAFDLESLIPGDWLAISSLEQVVELQVTTSGVAWVATTGGVFGIDLSTGLIVDVFTTNDGLHATNPTSMALTSDGESLVIGYADGALDIVELEARQVKTRFDIVRSTRFPDKSVRSVEVLGDAAYIATGFGIVVYDADTWLVRESALQFGAWPLGLGVQSMDIRPDGSVWVATSEGVATSPSTSSLSLPSSWQTWSMQEIGSTPFTWIRALDQGIVAATSSRVMQYKDNVGWSTWDQAGSMESFDVVEVPNTNQRVLLQRVRMLVFQGDNVIKNIPFEDRSASIELVSSTSDATTTDEITLLRGSLTRGVVEHQFDAGWGETATSTMRLNTPATNTLKSITMTDHGFLGAVSETFDNNFISDRKKGMTVYSTTTGWTNVHQFTNSTMAEANFQLSFQSVATESYAYVGSWGSGIARMALDAEGTPTGEVRLFNAQTSSLRGWELDNDQYVVISGLEVDSQGRLWTVSRFASRALAFHDEGSEDWTLVPKVKGLSSLDLYEGLFIDSRDWKWVFLKSASRVGRGVMVLDTGADPTSSQDDQAVVLNAGSSSGNLPDATVTAVLEDQRGEIWIGTERGIAKLLFPDLLLVGGVAERTAQWLIAENPTGPSPYLLRDINVTAMAINGANQKWIATANDGLWLVNAAGTAILEHFTQENSPLLSDAIEDLAFDPSTGNLFVSTSVGVQIYQDRANQGASTLENLSVYPSPFSYERDEEMILEGLPTRSRVRVVTIDGQRVKGMEAEGGRVRWNGLSDDGKRLSTGVYIVIALDRDGKERAVGKVAIVR